MRRGQYTVSDYTEHLRTKLISDINYLGELKNQGKRHTLEYQEVNDRIRFGGVALKRRYEIEKSQGR